MKDYYKINKSIEKVLEDGYLDEFIEAEKNL